MPEWIPMATKRSSRKSPPAIPNGEVLADFPQYAEAVAYVEKLVRNDFPAGFIAIVGSDLRSVERVRGKMSYARVAFSGAVTGAWIGLIYAFLFGPAIDTANIASDANGSLGSAIVIGAGVIGLEMGSVYARLGTQVTVVEYLDAITPGMDGEVQKTFQRMLKKQGLKFVMGAAVQSVQTAKTGNKVLYKLRKNDKEEALEAEVVLVATGRRPFTAGLGLEALGVEMTGRGQIATNHYATNIPGLYAIGDATPGPMLAHKAEDEGVALAEILAGQKGHVNYGVIPGVI